MCGKSVLQCKFATQRWSSCGKQAGTVQFATRERLSQQDIGSQLLFCVANFDLMLYLPHGKGWNSWTLIGGRWLLWQILTWCFICHTEVKFVWQTGWQYQVCHTGKVGFSGYWQSAVILCGNFGADASFATQKRNSCGKQAGSTKFATRERLD